MSQVLGHQEQRQLSESLDWKRFKISPQTDTNKPGKWTHLQAAKGRCFCFAHIEEAPKT